VVELQAGYLSGYFPTQNCNGKIHLAAAIGFALVENGLRALFMRTGELVQRLQIMADRCQSALRRVGQVFLDQAMISPPSTASCITSPS
jgi:DNA replication protein DnaC